MTYNPNEWMCEVSIPRNLLPVVRRMQERWNCTSSEAFRRSLEWVSKLLDAEPVLDVSDLTRESKVKPKHGFEND